MVYPKTAPHYAPAENATGIVDGVIVNDDINAAAGITEGKLAIASGKILIGTAGGVGAAQTLSGNATVTAAGVVSVLGGAAAAASDFLVVGRADKKIIMKLGDVDGDATFRIVDSADADLFKQDSTGLITLKNGAILDNTAAADTLNITETKVRVTGNLTVTGTSDLSGAAVTLPANTVSQSHMNDDAIGVAEAKIAVRDIQVGIGATTATVTTAGDINGQLLNAYFVGAADATATQIVRQEFLAASGKVEVTVNAAATAATDIRCLILQA